MDESTLLAASRRFPLLSRPRPACPSLPERVDEIARIAQGARADGVDVLMEATHALNKAALLVSDAGLTAFARDLCWQQINIFREAGPVLTSSEVGYMLAPVLNLARLSIRSGGGGNEAIELLENMLQAIRDRADLQIDGRTLPVAGMVGTREEHRKLYEWAWKACIADGVRALALQGRWKEAVDHAQRHRGIGLHLMEGRQAVIIAACFSGDGRRAVEAFEGSTLTQPWERQVASCLGVMTSYAAGKPVAAKVQSVVDAFRTTRQDPGYAPYYARLGATVATLAAGLYPKAADQILARAADEALRSKDGYAARELAGFKGVAVSLDDSRRHALLDIASSAGLGVGSLPEALLDSLMLSGTLGEEALAVALKTRSSSIGQPGPSGSRGSPPPRRPVVFR